MSNSIFSRNQLKRRPVVFKRSRELQSSSTFLSPDVLLASVFMWWLNKLCGQLHGRTRFNYKDVLMCSYKKQTLMSILSGKNILLGSSTLPCALSIDC